MIEINLIGKKAAVTASQNQSLIGIQGTITDETKNTITINNKVIIKDQVTINVEGKNIKPTSKTPEERIKVKK